MKKIIVLVFMIIILLVCLYPSIRSFYLNSRQRCDIKPLILDDSAFDKEVQLIKIKSPISEAPDRSVASWISLNNTITFTDIIDHSTVSLAEKKYAKQRKLAFETTEYEHSWKTPEFPDAILSTETGFYACGISDGKNLCRFAAQYQNYSVYMFMSITEGGFTVEDFHDAIVSIDHKMTACLEYEENENTSIFDRIFY